MSDYPVTRGARPGDPHLRLRLAALTAVIVGVILVALAAFLLSYSGIHQIALQAGVSAGLARLYPLMFDAMLIITCSAVLATRTAGWGTKVYVWVCLLLVLGAVAVGDALYATGVHLTGQAARATIAVVPWVLLLLGFGIWLVMLRHWRRIRMAGAVNGAEAGRPTQADRNGHAGHAGRAVPVAQAGQPDRAAQAGQPDRAPQAGQPDRAAQAGQADRAAQAGQADRAAQAAQADRAAQAAQPDRAAQAAQPDRAAQAMAASAAAAGASWAARGGATAGHTRAPRVGIDTLLEQQAGRAPERPAAADSPAANRATPTGQGKQRTTAPGERQSAGVTAATTAGTTAAAAAGTAAGIAAGTAAGAKSGARGDTKPGTAEETRPGTTTATTPGTTPGTKPGAAATTAMIAAATTPGTPATTPGTAAGTKPGAAATTATTAAATAPGTTATTPGTTATASETAGTTPGSAATTSGTADTGAGADADAGAGAGAIGSADPASAGQDSGGKDKAGAQVRRRRLGGLLEVPASEDDEEGSVRILLEPPKTPAKDAASSQDGGEADGTGDGKETPASAPTEGSKTSESMPAGTADPDPANPPAPLPHFDRPRSTPTPPQETGADGD